MDTDDAPMACSVTPQGNRVTVYWDHRRAQNVDLLVPEWEDGIVAGLLHSLCFLPILSYGGTAPLANIHHDASTGWATEPLGLQRLEGTEMDREDDVLQVDYS